MNFKELAKKELKNTEDLNYLKSLIEAGKKSSSREWNRQFGEAEQRIREQHTQNQVNRLENDDFGSSSNSKWGNNTSVVGLD